MELEQTKATTRALMALMPDVAALVEATERVRIQIEALACGHGLDGSDGELRASAAGEW